MNFADMTLQWQRWLIAAMLLGSAVIILPPAVEPFMLPKATFLVVLAIALVGLGVARAAWARRLNVPVSPVTVTVGVFLAALVVATVSSPAPLTSVIGLYGRYQGLAPYVAYLVVFAVALRVTNDDFLRLLRRTAVVALAFVVGYGLLQAVGLEPFEYTSGLGTTFSFLGNTNFSGAWAGAVSAPALVTALSRDERRQWRIFGGALVPLTVAYVFLTETLQGPVVALVALAWVGAVLAAAPDALLRRSMRDPRHMAVAASVALLAFVLAGVAAVATLRAQLALSFRERLEFWAAGRDIFLDNAVLGTGLDTYGHHFQAYRPASHALLNGLATTDSPHSVPLGMFSNGGIVLGVAYVAVVLGVGFVLARAAWRVDSITRPALAGFGGVWVGYQVQSLISFDVPPLALLHWLSAGVVVAVAAPPRWREVTLPGVAAHRRPKRKRSGAGAWVVPPSTRALHAATAVVGVAAAWLALYPLRADLVSASGAPLTKQGRYDEALERFQRAADLNPAEPTYALLAARSYEASGQRTLAFESGREAAARDPGTVGYALYTAQQARLAGMQQEALRWYRETIRRDPLDPPVLTEAGDFLLELGEAAEAERVLERSVELRPEVKSLVLLGQARLAQGDVEGARGVAEQALALNPDNDAVKQLLARLS